MTPREKGTNVSNMPSPGYINDTQIATFVGYIVNIKKDLLYNPTHALFTL